MNEFNEDYRKKKLKKNGEVMKRGGFAGKKNWRPDYLPSDKISKKPLKNSAGGDLSGKSVGAVLLLKR